MKKLSKAMQEDASQKEWLRTTYTICGVQYRFAGQVVESAPGRLPVWYVFVDRMTDGQWQRISYGFQLGQYLPDIARSWALAYVSTR